MIQAKFPELPGKRDGDQSEPIPTVSVPRVLVANKSGADVPLGGILGIDGPPTPYNPSTSDVAKVRFLIPSQVVLSGVTPTVADHCGKWVVPLRPLAPNYHFECKADGVARVRVYVNGADDGYCDVIAAETVGEDEEAETCYLGTGVSGAQILWRENEGSGAETIVWAIVRLGQGGPGHAMRCSAILTADAGPGASVDVDNVVPLDGGQSPLDDPDDTTETISATMPPAARALDDAVCVIERDENGDAWKITQVHEQARMLRGTLSGAMADSDPSKTITSPVSMDGGQVPTGTITGVNVFSFEGDSSGQVFLVWNEAEDQYEIIQCECPA